MERGDAPKALLLAIDQRLGFAEQDLGDQRVMKVAVIGLKLVSAIAVLHSERFSPLQVASNRVAPWPALPGS
jgi:hypothetical protein